MFSFKKNKKSNDFKIDLVYLWVDGTDPKFIEQRKFYQQEYGARAGESNCTHNYVDHDELRYSLRSVFENAPWINKIYIVTNGQVPKWLDLAKTDKIKIVTHDEIMPKDALPTFHSDAIEACIANIPELEEHFLVANDDTFINSFVTPSFFFDKKGNPIARLKRVKYSREGLKISIYSRKIKYTNRLINRYYKKNFLLAPHHNIDAYRKSMVLECKDKFKEEFDKVIYSKFRNTGVQRLIFSLYSVVNHKGRIEYLKPSFLYTHKNSVSMRVKPIKEMLDIINKNTPNLLCINDHINVDKYDLEKLKTFLEYLYPKKQIFEKDEKIKGIYPEILEECAQIEKKYNLLWKIVNKIIFLLSPFVRIQDNNKCIVIKLFSLIKVTKSKDSKKKIKKRNVKKDYKNVQKNYKNVLKKISKKVKNNEPINVLFLSNEISKWGYSDLYRKFEQSPLFNPKIIVYPLLRVHLGRDKSQPPLQEQYDFYKNQGFSVEYGYEDGKYFDPKDFDADILFYPQGRSMPEIQRIIRTSKYALSFYISYSFDVVDSINHYESDFHKLLFTYFTESQSSIERFESYKKGNSKNCYATGYPKLDAYLDNAPLDYKKYWREPEKFKIIYAPHHSFEKDGLHLATFKQNGKLILELAKSHPETTWVFKPHPRFQFALSKNKVMNKGEIEEYYKEWQEIGMVFEGGNYIDLFRTSDLMITDCGSFLGEYLPSQKPLIQLINPKTNFNSLGNKVRSEYYFSHNNDELKQLFDEIVVKKNDYKKEARLKLAKEVFDFSQPASDKMFKYVENVVLKAGEKECRK